MKTNIHEKKAQIINKRPFKITNDHIDNTHKYLNEIEQQRLKFNKRENKEKLINNWCLLFFNTNFKIFW